MKSIELRQEKWRILTEARKLIDGAEAEKRDLTDEEKTNWQKAMDDMASLDERIKRQEYLESTPATDDNDSERRSFLLAQDRKAGLPQTEEEAEARFKRAYHDAYTDYLIRGVPEMDPEKRAILLHGNGKPLSKEERSALGVYANVRVPEQRAQEIGNLTLGGFWAPDEMQQAYEKAELFFGGMRQVAKVISTTTGNTLPWPVFDDTANTGRRITENAAFTETNVTVAVRNMQAFMYSSDEVLVSRQFLQDVPINVDAWLGDVLGERVGRITNTEFTTYAGADGPQGIIRASTLGVTAGATGAVTADELLTLQYAVNRAYRNERAVYMMADATIRTIMQLKDGEGRYLFIPDPRGTAEPTIHGKRVVVNNDMPALATGNITIEFGDFSHYLIRDVVGFTVLRLEEIRARNLQVVFLGFSRHDGAYINAGQNPIQHLIQA